jgi:hypothetical protein
LTGRANYQRFGDLLDVDLVAEPPRAAMPEVAFRVAGLFWSKIGLNELADLATPEAFTQITKRINGGTNGWRSGGPSTPSHVRCSASRTSLRRAPRAAHWTEAREGTAFDRGAEAIRAYAQRAAPREETPREEAAGNETAGNETSPQVV